MTGLLGYAHALSGRSTEAISLLEDLLVRSARNAFTRIRDTLYLGEAYLRAERPDRALATAQRARGEAGPGQRGNEAHARLLMGTSTPRAIAPARPRSSIDRR